MVVRHTETDCQADKPLPALHQELCIVVDRDSRILFRVARIFFDLTHMACISERVPSGFDGQAREVAADLDGVCGFVLDESAEDGELRAQHVALGYGCEHAARGW